MTVMTATEDFLAKLNPKIAKALRKASEVETEFLPLASYGLTEALGGGIGKRRIALFYGNRSSGKSALLMQSAGEWQRQGKVVAYVDVEGTWDNKWARRLGVNTDELILIQRKSTARVYNEIKPLLEAGIDAIIIDSISMLLPDSFIDDDGNAKPLENQKTIGAKARSIRSLIDAIHFSNENTAVAIISQTTTDLSGMHPKQVPDGGKKMEFACSQIIKLTSSNIDSKQKKGDIQVGNKIIQVPIGRTVQSYVEKNKMAPQGRAWEYDFYYDGKEVGIDVLGEVIDKAVAYGVINKGGAWFNFGDQKWQGRDALVAYARENPGFVEEVKAALTEATKIG